MKNYTVYFEIYGKKMKTRVLARDKVEAKARVAEKMIFHKVEADKVDDFNRCMDIINEIGSIIGNDKK